MRLKTDADINGASARVLRGRLKLSQAAFWGSVYVSQPSGSQYEAGKAIPSQIRKLLFLKYVAGLDLDTGEPQSERNAHPTAHAV